MEPPTELALAAHRLHHGGPSLAVAATASAIAWLIFLPLDLDSVATGPARFLVMVGRIVPSLGLLAVAVHLGRRRNWLAGRVGQLVLTGLAVSFEGAFLALAWVRTDGFEQLDVAAVLLGTAVMLFAPISLGRRAGLVSAFYLAFVVISAAKDIEALQPGQLALNLAIAAGCGLLCALHLTRNSRSALLSVRREREANAELSRQISEAEALRKVLTRQASTDPLTGALNRRALFERANRHSPDSSSTSEIWLAVLDVDRFKAINDTYGHAVGDEVLTGISDLLSSTVRAGDLVARIGGEEFALLLPGLTRSPARELGGRIQAAVGSRSCQTSAGPIPVTVSVGLARWDPGESFEVLLRRADQAMYQAKKAGGNQVLIGAAPGTRGPSIGPGDDELSHPAESADEQQTSSY